MQRICVFCGSSSGARPEYAAQAEALGEAIVRHGCSLVYGGGKVGLMGIIADAVLACGGEVIGVIPEALMRKEVGHTGLTELRVVHSMHERKAIMADLADAFIAMPGGIGTFEEFFEITTWAQLGIHSKPCGVLNVKGYFDPMLDLINHAVAERFLKPQHAKLISASDSVEDLLTQLENFTSPHLEKWLDREET